MKLYLALLATLALLAGCHATPAHATSDPVVGLASSAARIDVRADTITGMAKQLPEGLPRVTIVEQAGGIKADGHDLGAAIEAERVNEKLMAGTINNQTAAIAVKDAELDRLNDVWIAPRMDRWVAWGVAGFIATGVASIAFGVLSPLGWGMTISKGINTVLPFMTPFVWARDLILKLKGMTHAVVPTAIAATISPPPNSG